MKAASMTSMKLKRQVEMKVVKLSGPVAAKSAAWALAIIIIAASFIRTECNPVTLLQGNTRDDKSY
jgi:hypothetical protein